MKLSAFQRALLILASSLLHVHSLSKVSQRQRLRVSSSSSCLHPSAGEFSDEQASKKLRLLPNMMATIHPAVLTHHRIVCSSLRMVPTAGRDDAVHAETDYASGACPSSSSVAPGGLIESAPGTNSDHQEPAPQKPKKRDGTFIDDLNIAINRDPSPSAAATGDSSSEGNKNNKRANAILFGKEFEYSSSSGGFSGFDLMRFFTFNALAVFIALSANFLGVTSFLMSKTSAPYFRSLGLDQIYSIDGFRRNMDQENKYQFLIPDDWLIDQSIVISKANERSLPMQLRAKRAAAGIASVRPDAAYGPANGDEKENVSLIKSSVLPGFSMQGTLGEPREAAEKLLANSIAPASSGKSYRLIDAFSDTRGGLLTYTMEYTVQRDASAADAVAGANPLGGGEPGTKKRRNAAKGPIFQHNLSVITSRGTELFTLTATVPEEKWAKEGEKLKKIAESFMVEPIAPRSLPAGFY